MMKRILIILMFLYSTGYGAVDIAVSNYNVDSSASDDYAAVTIGHPRWNLAAFSGAGDVGFYMSGFGSAGRTVWKLTKNIDSTTRWVSTVTGTSGDILNHGHVSMLNNFDTTMIAKLAGEYFRGYSINGSNTIATNWTYTWPYTSDAAWFVATGIQLGSSDTILAIGRGGSPEGPKYAVSTNRGRNFGDTISIPSNASPFPGVANISGSSGRIGGLAYNGTAACIFDYRKDTQDSCNLTWFEWDRLNREWDEVTPYAISRSGVSYASE